MNLHQAATQRPLSQERHDEAETRLHGHWLLLARSVWFALVVLILSVYLASFPEYVVQLQTVCRLAACSYGQLSPGTVAALEHFGLSVGSYTAFMLALAILSALVCFGVGGVIYWRKSDDWMALLFSLILVSSGTVSVLLTVATSYSAWRLPILCVDELSALLFFLAFALFPNGRFVPRWTRWLLVVFSIESVVFTFFTNPFTAPLWDGVLFALFFSLYASLVITQIYRYRYVSNLVQRQQTKWVVYGLTVVAVSVGGFLPTLIFPRSLYPLVFYTVFTCTFALFPFTMGIAILRYRLWDIDVLINRTLVYGTLTVILTAVYVGLVIGLQALLRGIISQDNSVAIVISTLAIAALFQPLRHRLQQLIDRRFYRSKYDAAKIIEAFSGTLRNEVDLDQLREQLVAVVQETMQPTFVSLWLRKPTRTENQPRQADNPPL
jgi:hypothetical protein